MQHLITLRRSLQEYPTQLIQINDHDRLEKFLVEWNVFDELFDIEFSGALIKYWRLVSFHQFRPRSRFHYVLREKCSYLLAAIAETFVICLQGPGFDRMGEVYKTVMNNFVNAGTDRNLVGKRYIQMARFM